MLPVCFVRDAPGLYPYGGTPLPPVYWNHEVSVKIENDLFESIAYGQNLERQGLSISREPILRTGCVDMIDY